MIGAKMTDNRKPSSWAYFLPAIHLSACLASMVAYLTNFGHFGVIWVFVVLADLPVSALYYTLAWKYGTVGAVWVVVTGTLYWYWLSRGVEILINRWRVSQA